jgi:hypothetical protein
MHVDGTSVKKNYSTQFMLDYHKHGSARLELCLNAKFQE